eukprot:TRINITY_DN11203_c0_g1_i3.p2 TRINITY_DN11203_c0_g1~~TRINITY_DN11203_c0_g1_i3.p2  ORF type:complete len:127 (-),score=53.36 TRINITY_DN11203_c0_g1_i3:227-607(-)
MLKRGHGKILGDDDEDAGKESDPRETFAMANDLKEKVHLIDAKVIDESNPLPAEEDAAQTFELAKELAEKVHLLDAEVIDTELVDDDDAVIDPEITQEVVTERIVGTEVLDTLLGEDEDTSSHDEQ